MRRAILVAAVLFALLAKPAVALTGNELRQWCNQQGDPIAEGFCLGYVVGHLARGLCAPDRDQRPAR